VVVRVHLRGLVWLKWVVIVVVCLSVLFWSISFVRADDADGLWHVEMADGEVGWVAPSGVWEVYALDPQGMEFYMGSDWNFSMGGGVTSYGAVFNCWQPCYVSLARYSETSDFLLMTCPNGWVLSEGECIMSYNVNDFYVRFRCLSGGSSSKWYDNPSNVAYLGLAVLFASGLIVGVGKKGGWF
jgi:hypothetical protein